MRVVLIGCVKSSEMALRTLLDISGIEVCGVVTKEKSRVNSDFTDLKPICDERLIPYHEEVSANRTDTLTFLRRVKPDIIYCIGWSYLLDKDVIKLPRLGVVGFHPAALPKNRGRHPIIWALVLGLQETASTFFMIDEGTDSGPILSQKRVQVYDDDDSNSLYQRIMNVATSQLKDITRQFLNGQQKPCPQDDTQSTYWRKRDRRDGILDFRMSAKSIKNLVRALRPPYPCAEFLYEENYYKTLDATPYSSSMNENIEFGKVLSVKKQKILVKLMGTEAIWLTIKEKHNILEGVYLR